MADICLMCSKVSDDIEKLEITLCRECFANTKRITIEPKVKPTHSVTRSNKFKQLNRTERFNFISLTSIIGGIVACYLYSVDAHFRRIVNNIYHATVGKLSIDSGVVIVVLVVLVVVLFARWKS